MKGPDNSSGGDAEVALSGPTSVTLLEQVKRGDPYAWERLLKLYRPLVLWWCRGKVRPREDAEDVAQEVFETVFRRIDEFTKQPERGGFRAWLRAIAYHKVGDYWRRVRDRPAAAGGSDAQERLAEVPDALGDDSAADPDPSERCILLRSALELVRAEFQPNTWEAAWRTSVDARPAEDVAKALGMTTAAVYIAKSRVLKRLREEMAHLLE
jgi:RNA polymerase sigma-70 factor (ECF subfamily)